MTRLTLIRHGQTPSNVLGLLDTGAPGPGLTELGHQQASALPRLLIDLPVDAVYVSKLVRTHATALPLADDRFIDRIELPGIHEVEAGSLEMRGDDDAVRRYMSTAFAWGAGDLDARIPEGPDGYEFFGRYDADIERAVREASHPVIVSHGAAIRIWVGRSATNIDPEFTAVHHLPNTGVVELEGEPGNWRLLSWPNAPVTEPDPIDFEVDLPE
ncbi:MAG TPA: histidine phosphatase family protein [Microbacteriaceae bacterium]|nr:histidine phosphatase family protein [Microbacteriaceae bacterium]